LAGPDTVKVLLAIDGSSAGDEALRIACELFSGKHVTINVLHVMRGSGAGRRGESARPRSVNYECERLAANTLLDAAVRTLRQAGVGPCVLTQIDVGDPPSSVFAAVEASMPDVLVIGYQRVSRAPWLHVGSAWERLVARARCSVIVARARVRVG
jgi:nucleotide-binding universal stress UspA family protein